MRYIQVIILSFFFSLGVFAQSNTYYVNASSLNLRSEAHTTAIVLAKLPQGAAVTIESETGAWSKITVNEKTGYVATKFLSKTKVARKKQVLAAKVLICGSSSSVAYHSFQCRGLSRCKSGISEVTKSQAKNRGYRACKICY